MTDEFCSLKDRARLEDAAFLLTSVAEQRGISVGQLANETIAAARQRASDQTNARPEDRAMALNGRWHEPSDWPRGAVFASPWHRGPSSF